MTRFLLYTETYPSRDAESPRQTGIGGYCSDLVTGLRALGHRVAVLTNDDRAARAAQGQSEPLVERVGREPRWPHELLYRARLLRRRLEKERPDYLLVGDPVAHQVVALARLPADVRYGPLFYGTELRAYGDLIASRGWRPFGGLRRRLLTSYIGRARQPVVISRYTARCLTALGLPHRPACIVFPAVGERFLTQAPRAVAIDDPRSRESSVPSDSATRFITVARISERKNQLQVLETLAALKRQHGLRFEYLIVGNVDGAKHKSYLSSIRRFVREHMLDDSVRVIERATDAEKIAWIDASDVFVMLSRTVGHSVEGFGISAIEASCRGKPVVVSDEGGMPETILEARTGFSVPIEARDRLAAILLDLAREPGLRRALGAAGQRFVRDNFTPRRMAERFTAHLDVRHSSPHALPVPDRPRHRTPTRVHS
jgi:glycosyltransferase involved in cell wall biosynthesis